MSSTLIFANNEIKERLRRLANYAECRNPELKRAQDKLRKVVLRSITRLELAKSKQDL